MSNLSNLSRVQEPKQSSKTATRAEIARDTEAVRRRLIRGQLKELISSMTITGDELKQLVNDVLAGRDEPVPTATIATDCSSRCFRCNAEIKRGRRTCSRCLERPACLDCGVRVDRYAKRCVPCAQKSNAIAGKRSH